MFAKLYFIYFTICSSITFFICFYARCPFRTYFLPFIKITLDSKTCLMTLRKLMARYLTGLLPIVNDQSYKYFCMNLLSPHIYVEDTELGIYFCVCGFRFLYSICFFVEDILVSYRNFGMVENYVDKQSHHHDTPSRSTFPGLTSL